MIGLVVPYFAFHMILEGRLRQAPLKKKRFEHQRATPNVLKRLQFYFLAAEAMGADVAVCTCTTVGEASRLARGYLSIPAFNIDEPMAVEAVRLGRRIGIVATVPTSPVATQRQLDRAAGDAGVPIRTTVIVVEKAFESCSETGQKSTMNWYIARWIV